MAHNVTPRDSTDLELHFKHVCFYHKNKAHKETTHILNDSCGSFRAGRLSAILGPSGAGKSTLLNVLAGFKVKDVSGQFLLNGQPRDLMSFCQMSCYIEQNFSMLSLLTVEETLRVSADLKLPTSTTKQQKQIILDDIIKVLDLHACRHNLVGDISGGEHKRLSIGIELITNPPIMFFDEPTSGLDSVVSYQVMCYLQQLAQNGRIVVCVVHQPSSRLMQLFDDVLVLAHGEVLYSGPQSEMLTSFESAGFSCPQYYNPADFVIEVCRDLSNQRCDTLIAKNRVKHDCLQSFFKGPVDEQTTLIDRAEKISTGTNPTRLKEKVDFRFQLLVLLKRHIRAASRNFICVQLRLFVHFFVALLLGCVYWQIGNRAEAVISNVSYLFFILLFLFFGNALPSILLCLQDSSVFLREYKNGWYTLRAYYTSKIVADLPMQLVCATVFISISYFLSGQLAEGQRFAMCWSLCVMISLIGHLIGVIAGTLLSVQMAIFIVPTSTIPFLLFSGFFVRMRDLPLYFRPICDISFLRYTFEGLMRATYAYGRGNLQCNMDFCYFKSSEQFLKGFDMVGDFFSWDLMALSLFLVLLLFAFYLSLQLCIRRAL